MSWVDDYGLRWPLIWPRRWTDDRQRFFSDEPARACRHCHAAPIVGRVGNCFSIRCLTAACAVQPHIFGWDEQAVRGRWLIHYAIERAE